MGKRQQSIEIKGHGHRSPTPMACKVGPFLATSGVSGKNVKTGEMPKDPDQQTKHAFINMAAVLKETAIGESVPGAERRLRGPERTDRHPAGWWPLSFFRMVADADD